MSSFSVAHAIALAQQHCQAGRFGEAAACCRAVLEVDPRHAEALHLLGISEYQAGRAGSAVGWLQQAVALAPEIAAFHCNLGLALEAAGSLAAAVEAYGRAIALDPADAATPGNLGIVLQALGRHEEAIAAQRRAVELDPRSAESRNNLGNALRAAGELEAAVESYRHALRLNPAHAGAHNNLGNALRDLGQLDEAAGAYRRALEIQPRLAEAHANLGNVFYDQSRTREAQTAYRAAIALRPDYATAHNNLGNALRDEGRWDEAVAAYREALRWRPDYAEVHNNLGALHARLGELDAAIAAYREALRGKPDYVDALNNLGVALKEQGALDEAVAVLREALRLRPDHAQAHSNLIFTLDLLETVELAEQQGERRRWAERHAQKFAVRLRSHGNSRDPDRRLRIGHVSADFCRHSACAAFGAVVCRHDPEQYEVHCYSGVRTEDDATARLRAATHGWCSTLALSDDALAERIRRDEIDILVDLAGHSAGHRLLTFARRPAPVQASAWGHPTGTGLAAMDYLLADPVWVPEAERPLYAERVIDLPCFLCFEPPAYLPPPNELPALANGTVTYACTNRIEKISDHTLALWREILRVQPGSRLLVKDKRLNDPALRLRFLARLRGGEAVAEERVRLLGASSHEEHLRTFHEIDIALDPFPQTGGASTGEALWMGVPVLTLHGSSMASRSGAALLSHVGLSDWIATSDEEYVRLAVEAARNLPRLAALRAGMRAHLAGTVYGDLPRYTRAVEAVYRTIWRRWCESGPHSAPPRN